VKTWVIAVVNRIHPALSPQNELHSSSNTAQFHCIPQYFHITVLSCLVPVLWRRFPTPEPGSSPDSCSVEHCMCIKVWQVSSIMCLVGR